jgi:hypothetical protein
MRFIDYCCSLWREQQCWHINSSSCQSGRELSVADA